jgi:hypothetical protein
MMFAPPVYQASLLGSKKLAQDEIILDDSNVNKNNGGRQSVNAPNNLKSKGKPSLNINPNMPLNSFIQFMNASGFSNMSTNRESSTSSHPDVIVGVTTSMRNNLQKFGDVVSFEMTDTVVKDENQPGESYRLSFFTVFDTNCRILLVGVALHKTDSVADLFQVFKFFFKLQQKKPAAIITSWHPSAMRTMDILSEIYTYKGVHLLDRECVLDDISSNFEYDEKVKQEIIRLSSKVIKEGNQEHALKALD